MSHVMGKNREELLAMARGHGEVKKGLPTVGEFTVKEESTFSARIKVEDPRKDGPAGRASSKLTSDVGSGGGSSSVNALTGAVKRASNVVQSDRGGDGIKVEDAQADRTFGEKKPRTSVDEGPSMTELSGYNSKMQEFEIEYDNDAEQLLADMEFKDADTEAECELKLLDERKRRKDFILERNLLYTDPFEKGLSPEEREICQLYRGFMRFHSKEEHQELLKSIVEEYRIMKLIKDLQEDRAPGCRTSADAERYIEQKRKREAEENARRTKDLQGGPTDKFLQTSNHFKGELDSSSPRGSVRGSTVFDSSGKDSPSTTGGLTISNSLDDWDVTGVLGADLLAEAEKW